VAAFRGFVVVSGPPASGKSSLAPALAAELDLPLLAKDVIKDALAARLVAAHRGVDRLVAPPGDHRLSSRER
jgi:predicted kinase